MSNDPSTPSWVRNAARLDRPKIDSWYKPEQGHLEGTLIWRGREEHTMTGEAFNAYAVRTVDGSRVLGVSERAGLRVLRTARLGSRVFIRPTEKLRLKNGGGMQGFEVFAEQVEPLGDPVRGAAQRGMVEVAGGTHEDVPSPSDKVPF